ncbi:MAG: endonuclease domain-containing protein [Dehalococcoidia bacterium]
MHADNVPAARRLRKELTPTEAILWERRRDRRCMNPKFRRQHPVGRFVLDFYCESLRVGIEVDGGIHLDPEQRKFDEERQLLLEEKNIRFIRIPSRLVTHDTTALMSYLTETLSIQSGTPLPSRESGRGEGRPSAQERSSP